MSTLEPSPLYGRSRSQSAVNDSAVSPPAYTLVKALENLIVPIIHAHHATRRPDVTDAGKPSIADTSKVLLDALTNFVCALASRLPDPDQQPEVSQEIEMQDAPGDDHVEVSSQSDPALQIDPLQPEGAPLNLQIAMPGEAPILKESLTKLRAFIFNKMPIRMLKFNPDGTGIKLVERAEVFRDAASEMTRDFYQGNFQAQIFETLPEETGDDEDNTAKHLMEKQASSFCSKYQRYAILSHTWLQDTPGEVVYGQWENGNFDKTSPGYLKISNFCRAAARDHGLTLGWMDTLCINKASSSELDESIRSMYSWYSASSICLTYLRETTRLQDMHKDPWFGRGWTLQELIAPSAMTFYSADWQMLAPPPAHDHESQVSIGADKRDPHIIEQITQATTITKSELTLMRLASISRKMQWAANRQVTREEDSAYSLMGIFDVSISIAYGEGSERAFFRLIKEILATADADKYLDIANHGHGPDYPTLSTVSKSVLIPSSPRNFLWRAAERIYWYRPAIPTTLTQLGLHIQALLLPGVRVRVQGRLQEWPAFEPQGAFFANVDVHFPRSGHLRRCYNLLDRKIFDDNVTDREDAEVSVFAVLNFATTATTVSVPHRQSCFAVMFRRSNWDIRRNRMPPDGTSVAPWPTLRPIVFKLRIRAEHDLPMFIIEKSDLENHGMYLRTLYM